MNFRPHERIRRRPEFKLIFERGAKVHSRYSTVFIMPNAGTVGRLGIAATRKLGGAVQRNRARRILREAWRVVAPTAADGNDVVLVAREAIRGAKTQDLVAEMTELLRREPLVRR